MPQNYRGFDIPQYGDKPWADVDVAFNKAVIDFMLDNAAKNGAIFIRDIQPVNPTDNISNKIFDNSGSLISFTTTTNNIVVSVLAITGNTSYKPVVKVNDNEVSLTQISNQCQFTGNITLDITGYDKLFCEHQDGATWETTFNYDLKPIVTLGRFIGNYPGTQTELKSGDLINFRVECDSIFSEIHIENFGASNTRTITAINSNTHEFSFTIPNRGNSSTLYGIRFRVKKSNGTFSDYYTTSDYGNDELNHVVRLCNQYPYIASSTITYPPNQQAIKNSESVSASFTPDEYDTFNISSSSDLSISGTFPSYFITRLSGDYIVNQNNITITMNRLSNNATSVLQYSINIVNTAPTAYVNNSQTRYRSGGNLGTSAQNYTFDLIANQSLIESPTITVPSGTIIGSPTVVGGSSNGTWRFNLRIHDNDNKGTFNYTGLQLKGLSGITSNVFTGNNQYTIGGFVFRTFTVPAWTGSVTPVDIGTFVSNTSKLRCTNLSKGASGSLNFTYQSDTTPNPNKYTIITNRNWYNCDIQNAQSNSSGTMRIELEEVV